MHDLSFLQNARGKTLTRIGNIHFTPREIDVISCLLNSRGTSKIAALLSIAPSTVLTHIQNVILKLTCSSRDGIIDFIEKYHKSSPMKKHYSDLVLHSAFEKSLTDIAKLTKEKSSVTLIVHGDDQAHKNAFIHYLKIHLKRAGFFAHALETEHTDVIETTEYVLSLYLNKKEHLEDLSNELSESNFLDISEQQSYYLSVLEILKKLLPHFNLEKSFSAFKQHYEEMRSPFQEHSIVQENSFFDYLELIAHMNDKLKGQQSSPGALRPRASVPRQEGSPQNAFIIWKINAETMESLKASFETLALALALTVKDQTVFKNLQRIKNSIEKENKILHFVKKRLKSCSPWFLIYDNVETSTETQKYFPDDIKSWGKGSVLITTRDRPIKNNYLIRYTLQMGGLNLQQSFSLLAKAKES